MSSKMGFLIGFTAAHQAAFWFLAVGLRDTGSASLVCQLAKCVLRLLASPLWPLAAQVPSPFLALFFIAANSFLWALSAWYALAAWRRLCNLPPLQQRS